MFCFCSHVASESTLPDEPTDDPEVETLLDFTPVRRKCRRGDGWNPKIQRSFIILLVALGSPRLAAQAVGRTESGAYKVRTSIGAESFAIAWDRAIELFHKRNPRDQIKGRPPRGLQGSFEKARGIPPAGGPDFEPDDPEAEERLKLEVFQRIVKRYILMLDRERIARLEGRIVEADFYVRQLFFAEVVLDLGGQAQRVLEALRPGGMRVSQIVATPMSVYLDGVRRSYWSLQDEPERPPLPELGEHDDKFATGPCRAYMSARDGPDMKAWERRRAAQDELAAEAQAAWEEKARRDAAEWRRREEGKPPDPPPGKGAEGEDRS
jgi:hypothetical protein